MPIFMIGTQRSGSNLLRLMLDQLDGIAAPHPPHILHAMMPLAGGYGDLTENGPFSALVEDVCRFVELAPIPWTDFRLDRADIARRARGRSLMAVCGAVYDAFADSRRAETWLCKSLYNVLYLPEIEKHFPKARYIHLYRDGRDVAVSFRKAPVGEKHFYHIAKQWSADQQLALAHRAAVPADRFIGVAYEDLTAHPDETMKRLCVFLGVGYRQEMLRFHESEDARRAAGLSALWGNVAAPIMAGNTRKFLQAA